MKFEIQAKLSSMSRWGVLFISIGLVAGLGSIVFHFLCEIGIHFFMDILAGHHPPTPAGEERMFASSGREFNRYILLIIPAVGGLISGWLVYTFSPEAEGHGTDAAIDSYHNKGGFIRGRVPIIKTLASAITLTSGGSGGREGPIAQIGAGFGSFIATKLKLSSRERRIMLAAGVGAGVGSIFRAPLAGALFAAEVLYRDPEMETEVIIPAGLSSVIAYCTFCMVFGWGALFQAPPMTFQNPLELGPYIVLALVLAAFGWMYVKCFYSITRIFRKLKIKNHFKPALGGLLTGIIGFFLPQTLSFGYGYVQQALNNELTVMALLALAAGKILTTSFSIGSGGSGGVFGPSVVIGGAIGGMVGKIFHGLFPALIAQPASFVIVGMAGFFAGVSNTPVSTVIFISEMTSSYHLLLPSMLVCSLCYLASQGWTIFSKQVKNRTQSPAHMGDFFVDILESIKVKDLEKKIEIPSLVPQDMRLSDFKKIFQYTKQHYFPVVDPQGRMQGIFSSTDVREFLFEEGLNSLIVMDELAQKQVLSVTLNEDLSSVMRKFTAKNIDSIPVVKEDDPQILLGMLNRKAVIECYNNRLQKRKHHEK
ncbi:MAG TPA: chloride channel protein [Desulfonatronum sp.]|nr:chloride channel protein [Desulfonatronum sp.]